MVMQNSLKQCHWNFKGPTFVNFHPYLGELSYLIDAYIDDTAENIRFLGEIPKASLTLTLKESKIKEREVSETIGQDQVVEDILDDLQTLMMVTQRLVAIVEDEKMYAMIDTFSGHLVGYDKMRYFLTNSIDTEGASSPTAKSILAKKDGIIANESLSQVMKTYEDERLVFGWASISKYANGTRPVDFQGDILDMEDMELPAYEYIQKSREFNLEHVGGKVAEIVESVVFTKEKMAAMGIPEGFIPEGWWVGAKVESPELFAKVKSGEVAMFSIEGSAQRVEVSE